MESMKTKFFVSRQKYYYSGVPVVEVTSGGLDYAGADMLVPKFPGEGMEYDDPVEAIEAAICICREWRKAGEKKASVGVGSTGGMGMELEPSTFADVRAWAQKRLEKMIERGEFDDGSDDCSVEDADQGA